LIASDNIRKQFWGFELQCPMRLRDDQIHCFAVCKDWASLVSKISTFSRKHFITMEDDDYYPISNLLSRRCLKILNLLKSSWASANLIVATYWCLNIRLALVYSFHDLYLLMTDLFPQNPMIKKLCFLQIFNLILTKKPSKAGFIAN
jgi:hypothetical protein